MQLVISVEPGNSVTSRCSTGEGTHLCVQLVHRHGPKTTERCPYKSIIILFIGSFLRVKQQRHRSAGS